MIHTDTLNEFRLRRGHDRGVQGPHHPCLPHRGRGRRPCAGHHASVAGLPNVLPSSTNPTRPFTAQHHRRASRHADGVPPSRSVDPRGSRLRRKPHPQGDHRGRGHSARPRRALDDVVGFQAMGRVGEVIIRTWQTARQDEAPARRAAGGDAATTTISAPSAMSRNTRSIRPSRMACRGISARSRPASSPISSLWSPAFFGVKPDLHHQGRRRSRRRRWAIPMPRSRRRSRCITGRCSAPIGRALTRARR